MKRAFTLVEMLVVIGILGILAAVLVVSLSGGTESANAAKCLSNMRALAMAANSFSLNNSILGALRFPCAGSFERSKDPYSDQPTEAFKGWIGWSTDAKRGDYVSPYSDDDHARYYCLTNGTLWKSVSCNRDVYVCPQHAKVVKKRLGKKLPQGPFFSFVMNRYFLWGNPSRSNPYSYSTVGRDYTKLRNTDHILLFAELPFTEITGMQEADFDTSAAPGNDPVLQYDNPNGSSDDDGGEHIGVNHRFGRDDYCAHICYTDGHTEKLRIRKSMTTSDLVELTGWLCFPWDEKGERVKDVIMNSDGSYKRMD